MKTNTSNKTDINTLKNSLQIKSQEEIAEKCEAHAG